MHNRKEEIRDKAAVLHQAKEYTYEAPIQEYREQQKPKTLKMIEMTPENNSEKQAESPEFPKMDFARPEPPVPQRGNSDQRRSIERRPAIPRGSIQQPKVLRPVILPINLYTKTDQASTVVPDDKDIAPYGRLLRCELVGTISTGSLQTPIRALVTESLWWNGVEIIPAGVELHGMVSGSPSRDRIGTSSSWIAVYPFLDERSAYQMQLTGIALDCNRTETSWGESDGGYPRQSRKQRRHRTGDGVYRVFHIRHGFRAGDGNRPLYRKYNTDHNGGNMERRIGKSPCKFRGKNCNGHAA